MRNLRNMDVKLVAIVTSVLVVFVIMIIFFINGFQNSAINLEEQINVAKSDISVQEERRISLIYNLVDCVKTYDEHEYNTLKDIVDQRTANNTNNEGRDTINTMIQATAEAYPDLKSSTNYQQLMTELAVTENLIAQYRSNYNNQVKSYKRFVKRFPNKQMLNMVGYEILIYDYLEYDASEKAPTNLFD